MAKQHKGSASGVEKREATGKASDTPTIEIYFDGQFGTDNNTGTIFANGLNEAHIVVRYTIPPTFPPPTQIILVDPGSPGTVYGPGTTMESKGWITKTTPRKYVKWFPYLNTDNPISAEQTAPSHATGAKDSTYYTKDLYISHTGRSGGSLYSMAAALQFGNNGWFYSTSGGTGKLYSVQVGLREPLAYSIDDLQGYGNTPGDRVRVDHPDQLDDDYYDKNDPLNPEKPGNCWRQNDYAITLKNKFDISDYFGADGRTVVDGKSGAYLYATRTRSYFRTFALLWNVGQESGGLNMWTDAPTDSGGGYQPRTIHITQKGSKGITISLVTYLCLSQVSLENSSNVSDPRIYFYDVYGNEGSFSLNMNIPKYYKDIIDTQAPFHAITPSSNTYVMPSMNKGDVGYCFNGAYGYIANNHGATCVNGWSPNDDPSQHRVKLDGGGSDVFPGKLNFLMGAWPMQSNNSRDNIGDASIDWYQVHPELGGVFINPLWLSNAFRIYGYRGSTDRYGYWKAGNSGNPRLVYASAASYTLDSNPNRFLWRFVDFNLE